MDTVQRLKLQALAPKWKMGPKGQRVVEKKEETKKRIGHSPDDMDAMNLAYYEFGWEAPSALAVPVYDDRPLGRRATPPGTIRFRPLKSGGRGSGGSKARQFRGRGLKPRSRGYG